MSDDERPAGAYDDHRVLNAIRDTLATGPLHEVHEMPDGTAFVGTAEEAALERTAAISDAYHEGFGAGIGSVQDEFAEQVAAAEQRGYDKAVANGRLVLADREKELLDIKGPCSNARCRLHYAHSGPCDERPAEAAKETPDAV